MFNKRCRRLFSILDKSRFSTDFWICLLNILGCDVLGLKRVTYFETLLRCTWLSHHSYLVFLFLIFFTFYLYTFHSFSYSLCASRSLCCLRCIDFVKPMKDSPRRLYLCNLWKRTTTTTTSITQPQFISCNGYEASQIFSCMFLFFFSYLHNVEVVAKKKKTVNSPLKDRIDLLT